MKNEEIFKKLVKTISQLDGVQSIGLSGMRPFTPHFDGDIDLFIYCDELPSIDKRKGALKQMDGFVQDTRINVFEKGPWGTGDYVSIDGIETWLMYFTLEETITNLDLILAGNYLDKVDNYYYPIARVAMFQNMEVLHEKKNFIDSIKGKIKIYPETLVTKMLEHHLDECDDLEDLQRAVSRKDVLFYHFALDLALDHFLLALFALNKTYFPSRKRSFEYIQKFEKKPQFCEERLKEVIRLGAIPDGIEESYCIWIDLVTELKTLKENHK